MRRITIVFLMTLLLITQSNQLAGIPIIEVSEPLIVQEGLSQSPVVNQVPGSVFKVINYNILEGGRKLDDWLQILKAENADMLFLSETGLWSPLDGSLDAGVAEINALFPDETPYAGVASDPDSVTDGQALLSRYPIKSSEYVGTLKLDNGDDFNLNHAILHAVVTVAGVDIHVIVEHFTCCGGGLPARLKEQESIINFIDGLGDVPIIYAGDFNSFSPEDVGDIAPNDLGLGAEPLDMLLNNNHSGSSKIHQFTDMYRTLNPYLKGYTYIDDTYESRIDYVFVNQYLSGAIVNATVLDFYPESATASDHLPVNGFFNMDYENTDLRPPIPPNDIIVNVTSSSVTLQWADNTEKDLESYYIYRNNSLLASLPKNTTSFTDQTAKENTIYQYMVHAVDNSTNISPDSVPVYVNPSIGRLYAPVITSFSVGTDTPGALELKWTVDDGGLPITEFRIYRALSIDGTYAYYTTVYNLNFLDEKVRAGLNLYYKVRGKNAAGFGWASDISSGNPLPLDTTESTKDGAPGWAITMAIPSIVTLVILRRRRYYHN